MTLDNCKGCGERVTDYDPNGFEGDDAQRGHFTCGQVPLSDRSTNDPSHREMVVNEHVNEHGA